MAVLVNQEKVRVKIEVGDEDVILIFNSPSTQALSSLFKSRYESGRRGKIKDRSFEVRVKFVDDHLCDVENVVYKDGKGEIKPLTNKVDGWKDLLNPTWKVSAAMHFEEPRAEEDLGNV